MPVILGLRVGQGVELRQEDCNDFEVIQDSTVTSRPAWATSKILPLKKKKKKGIFKVRPSRGVPGLASNQTHSLLYF